MKLFDVYPLYDINIVKGQGCKVWDENGDVYKRQAYVQHQFGHIKQKRRYFVGNTFSRMEVTGIQRYHLITGCALTDVEVIGTYCICLLYTSIPILQQPNRFHPYF